MAWRLVRFLMLLAGSHRSQSSPVSDKFAKAALEKFETFSAGMPRELKQLVLDSDPHAGARHGTDGHCPLCGATWRSLVKSWYPCPQSPAYTSEQVLEGMLKDLVRFEHRRGNHIFIGGQEIRE